MKTLIKLTRLYLSLAIAFSAVAGFIFFSHTFNLTALYTFLGVLLLSAGASALNQYQERHLDGLMKRTRNRPLPSKRMKPQVAMAISLILVLSGVLLLFFGTTPIATLLGIFNLFWYNVVYTTLKRFTSLAVFIGGLTGAIPPMMGWTAAGGFILAPQILAIAFFMFLWQIPHFYLLLLKFGEDYKAAGFPSILTAINENQVKAVIFVWILGTSGCTLFFPMYHIISGIFLIVSLLMLNVLLVYYFYRIVFNKPLLFRFNPAFRSLYLYQVIILVMLMIEALR
jgi:protoheme IX farnesyltransferase